MPKINWEELSEFKHHLQQERVIICGVLLALKQNEELDKPKFIERLKVLDSRLESFENHLIDIIEKYSEENNDRGNSTMGTVN